MWKRIFTIWSIVSILIMTVFVTPRSVSASPLTFGGKILKTIPCTNGGLWITVGPPRPGKFLYQFGVSRLFMNMKPTMGSWVLGDYTPMGTCVVGICPACTVWMLQGTVSKMGTS